MVETIVVIVEEHISELIGQVVAGCAGGVEGPFSIRQLPRIKIQNFSRHRVDPVSRNQVSWEGIPHPHSTHIPRGGGVKYQVGVREVKVTLPHAKAWHRGINLSDLFLMQPLEAKKEECFVAEKDSFFAHGITVKKAIKDLQFKIVAEKLKKDPILPDTKITVEYYRIITGACEHGTKSFQEQHNLKDEYSAKELLPILEKHGAYGIQNFKKLINW